MNEYRGSGVSREDINFCCHLGGLILERELCSLEGAHCHLSKSSDLYSRISQCLAAESGASPVLVAANFSWPPQQETSLASRVLRWSCQQAHNSHTLPRVCKPWERPISSTHTYISEELTSVCFARSAVTIREDIYHCLTIFIIFMLTCCHSEVGWSVEWISEHLAHCSRARSISEHRALSSFYLPFLFRPYTQFNKSSSPFPPHTHN